MSSRTPAERAIDGVAALVNRPVGVVGPRRRPRALATATRRSLTAAVDGKIVVVTGASSGIGEATAQRVAAAGGHVLLVARRRERLEDLHARITGGGGTAHVHSADLADLTDVDRLAAEMIAAHGAVDVLVNNAGRSIRRSLEQSTGRFHDFERTMQLNYFGTVRLILALLPSMRERRSGHIVNISSAGVQAGAPRFAAYVASKAALDAFSESAQAEVERDRVRFSTIYMPLVRTPMIEPTAVYRHLPAISPDAAASIICDAITHRPRRLGTLGPTALSIASTLGPRTTDRVRSAAFQLFPDSDGPEATDDSATPGRTAFTRLFPGVHW